MALERAAGGSIDIAAIQGSIEAALLALLRGLAESDAFNRLVLEAGLGWRDVAMVRALGRYLRQIRIPYAQDYLAETLARHGALSAQIVRLFYARFDPRADAVSPRLDAEAAIRGRIEEALKDVTSLDDDRILRRFVNLVEAALRTNFFQIDANGLPQQTIAFKFESAKVEDMPLPRPLHEIFVYSPRVEGVHLRFGKVARGGLRWSDRPQDYRTEVLGLVKAQQVKNAVIVPVGAKGGFFPKQLPPPGDRARLARRGHGELHHLRPHAAVDHRQHRRRPTSCRRPTPCATTATIPISSSPPTRARRPSPTPPTPSRARSGFWLDDAFASGGSAGYDHKKMGITARGAWEAVKRHFREMDIDIQTTPFTVAGVGDMSGDVFGNGMLLSRAIRLIAAFDHRDIFIDPNPDPAALLRRARAPVRAAALELAGLRQDSISAGGGVVLAQREIDRAVAARCARSSASTRPRRRRPRS